MLAELLDMCVKKRFALNAVPVLEAFAAQAMAAGGDLDGAIVLLRGTAEDVFQSGNFAPADVVTWWLVEKLLARSGEGDVAAAETAVDRLAAALPHAASGSFTESVVLRLRALLARANGDETGYRDYRDHYRAVARDLGFDGPMRWAEELP